MGWNRESRGRILSRFGPGARIKPGLDAGREGEIAIFLESVSGSDCLADDQPGVEFKTLHPFSVFFFKPK